MPGATLEAAGPALPGDLAHRLPRPSARLTLRGFRESDFADVHAYAGDEEVTRFLRWGPSDPVETLRFLRRAIQSVRDPGAARLDLAVVERGSGRVCGGLGLSRREPRRIEIGYCFARRVWGLGYATEAVRSAVGLVETRPGFVEGSDPVEVFALVSPANSASERVLARSGFERARDPAPWAAWMDGGGATARVWRRRVRG